MKTPTKIDLYKLNQTEYAATRKPAIVELKPATYLAISGQGAPYIFGFGTPKEIGRLFLTTYLFPFEIASLLLMVAAIGAVVLARRRRGLEGDDDKFDPRLITARSLLSGTMAESTGLRGGYGTEPDTETAAAPAPDSTQGGW